MFFYFKAEQYRTNWKKINTILIKEKEGNLFIMKNTIFSGVGVAIVTPMNKDFSINYKMMEYLLEYQIKHSIQAIIVAGTTGEASTLTDEEHINIIKFTTHCVNHRIPVIAGVGSNNTSHAIKLSKEAQKAGADALLHVTPYYNKCSQKGLVKHFNACANAADLPVMVYNIPSRTGVNIQPYTYERLCENERIVAVKEASGNLVQIEKTISICGDRLDIYSGNDDQIVPILALGGKGVVSVLANLLPEVTNKIYQNFFSECPESRSKLQIQYLELIEALFSDINPIPIKQALSFIGIDVGSCRLPLCEMELDRQQNLLKVLEKYKLCQAKTVSA